MTELSTARAVLKNIRVSSRKLNLVAAAIRGKSLEEAINYLKYCPKRVAADVLKTVKSAAANAENNLGLNYEGLYIKEAYVGQGLVLKRFRARAKGRGARIKKPFSRLSIVVADEMEIIRSIGRFVEKQEGADELRKIVRDIKESATEKSDKPEDGDVVKGEVRSSKGANPGKVAGEKKARPKVGGKPIPATVKQTDKED
jgi:large subunit ribosomal protein L22